MEVTVWIDADDARTLQDDVETPGLTINNKIESLIRYRVSAYRYREETRKEMADTVFRWASDRKKASEAK